MDDQIGQFIRLNIRWLKLPPSVQQVIGTQEEYNKKVVEFSIRNQLRYRGNLVRLIKKLEKSYYEQLLNYSREHLMLFPYHLSDFIVNAMRITPFQYYVTMMCNLLDQEKSYDTLPNFTAADCLRLLGIGRNQYIEIMNQCRSTKKFLSMIRRSPRELLPTKPVKNIPLEPWWHVCPGYITEDDIKMMVSPSEKIIVDKILDETNVQNLKAGNFSELDVRSLYLKGLIYLEVPIDDNDLIVVPPLEGFVMNRVTGDYFETLLYKIFISIDENTPLSELSQILQIDLQLVKNAVSMYCRLGFAYKKGLDLNSDDHHPSWRGKSRSCSEALSVPGALKKKPSMVDFFSTLTDLDKGDGDGEGSVVLSEDLSLEPKSPLDTSSSEEVTKLFNGINQSTFSKRIALLYDSTLAAFLMMGNLSPGLKSHAVTMFEVGKLPDESVDSLLIELSKISNIAEDEGSEAERYFLNAVMLYKTIKCLRYNKQLTNQDKAEGDKGPALDLIRCESLQNLDSSVVERLLKKNYKLLISVAPFSRETKLLPFSDLPHLGPPSLAATCPWFKLYLYSKTQSGPPSLLLARGSRLSTLPEVLLPFDHLLVTPWGRDAATIRTTSALFSINEAVAHSALLIQGFPSNNVMDEDNLVHIPFPVARKAAEPEEEGQDGVPVNPFFDHVDVVQLTESLSLNNMVGYLSLVNLPGESAGSENWTLFDCNFGVPLFDRVLNKEICQMIVDMSLANGLSFVALDEACRHLRTDLELFVKQYGKSNIHQSSLANQIDIESKHHYNYPSNCVTDSMPSRNWISVKGHLKVWP
ncbi:Protein FAM91A1 [Halotydeus destructor]|nr:Protein FAM91A1 [Halotydeus destructor]